MSGLELDFILYLGDPDEGAEALTSAKVLQEAERHRDKLRFPDVYGAITFSKKGKEVVPRKPDSIFSLITNLVRTVPYVIDGETESLVLSESEHGMLLEPSADDVLVSFFAGDAYEPDEYLLQSEAIRLADFGEQVLSMGERLKGIIEKVDPGVFEGDDYTKSLIEFLEMGRNALKTFLLEKERGLRVL